MLALKLTSRAYKNKNEELTSMKFLKLETKMVRTNRLTLYYWFLSILLISFIGPNLG